ncbi:DNA-methyltransferase [Helicobacter himalayensis]|uniref:DNA-methyltransferase n=1 Tax=Helicobacter himalayensis TaxID=1591088 RepID=UPI003D6F7846
MPLETLNTTSINSILQGDCIEILKSLESESVDLIFADPPYFMQTNGALLRVEGNAFSGCDDAWDKFENLKDYDRFSEAWLKECRRVLKKSGSIWVIGSFHNIYRLGYIMQNLGFWVLNDIVWAKSNPVPNFRGNRFCNAHESLIWCAKDKNAKYTFNYKSMKAYNNDKQMRSVWEIRICTGSERLKNKDGKKAHSTQKPEGLLERVILSSSKEGDLVLDPFFGSGTTGAVAKRFGRNFLGIEREKSYVELAKKRIDSITFLPNAISSGKLESKPPKVSLQELINTKFLELGEVFYDRKGQPICRLLEFNKVQDIRDNEILSIHKMAAKVLSKSNYNGWGYFYVIRGGGLKVLDSLRQQKRTNFS